MADKVAQNAGLTETPAQSVGGAASSTTRTGSPDTDAAGAAGGGKSQTHASSDTDAQKKPVQSGTPFVDCEPSLSEDMIAKLRANNFVRMTPVQAATIPQLLTHKDVCVEACTGSGKTLAFLIPLVELIRRAGLVGAAKGVAGLVVSPTRELSTQTHKVLTGICDDIPGYLQTGGVTVEDFMTTKSLGGSHETCILVATPGRLWDLIQRGALTFQKLEVLILDEADVLLDMGFQETISSILGSLPKQRRTGLFSATQSAGVVELIRAGLRNPVTIKVRVKQNADPSHHRSKRTRSQKTPLLLDNYFFVAHADTKFSHTLKFLSHLAIASNTKSDREAASKTLTVQHRKVIVFFATCAAVDFFYKVISAPPPSGAAGSGKPNKNSRGPKNGQSTTAPTASVPVDTEHGDSNEDENGRHQHTVNPLPSDSLIRELLATHGAKVFSLHGKMDSKRRVKTLEAFRAYGPGLGVLFCTDLAARGLDIPHVDWIVQYDPPLDPDFFVHRVGRTARAGNRGKALVFLAPRERLYTEFLIARKVPIADFAEEHQSAAQQQQQQQQQQEEEEEESTERGGSAAASSAGQVTPLSVDDSDIKAFHAYVRELALTDRDVMEKGIRAFVSHARAYREHRCRHIFKVGDLDFGRLARAYALLRLPKMPELRSAKGKGSYIRGFQEEPQAVVDAIPYRNKGREKQRQVKLAQTARQEEADAKKNKAGRGNKSRGASSKKHRKRRGAGDDDNDGGGGGGGGGGDDAPKEKRKRKGQHQRMLEEWDALAKEERLYKKMKRGKISKAEFERLMAED